MRTRDNREVRRVRAVRETVGFQEVSRAVAGQMVVRVALEERAAAQEAVVMVEVVVTNELRILQEWVMAVLEL